MGEYEFTLTAESDIYCGNAWGKNGPLREKSLLGALRWWTEAIIRAAGGYACDPTVEPLCTKKSHCVACDIFGCQGLAKRFSISIKREDGKEFTNYKIEKGQKIVVSFDYFHPALKEEYKALVLNAAYIMFTYGSVGGKIGQKPGKEHKDTGPHQDYGLFKVEYVKPERPVMKLINKDIHENAVKIGSEINDNSKDEIKKEENDKEAPNFNNFFFYICNTENGPISHDKINNETLNDNFFKLKKADSEGKIWIHDNPVDYDWQEWLRGNDYDNGGETKSKRLFVFNTSRVWGWAKDEKMTENIISAMAEVFEKDESCFETGEDVFKRLMEDKK